MREVHRRALVYAGASTVAVGALAGVLARMTVLVPLDRTASTVEARVGATLVVLLGLGMGLTALAAFTAVPLYGTLSGRVRSEDVPRLVFLSLGVVGCLAVGFVGVQPFAGGFADEHVETYGGFGGPSALFEVEAEPVGDGTTLVTFTHAGGDPLHADRLHVRGEGFADVDGADHVEPGVWRGTVSGERPRRGGPAVVAGDSVTVAITDDCDVLLVYEEDGDGYVVAGHHCEEP